VKPPFRELTIPYCLGVIPEPDVTKHIPDGYLREDLAGFCTDTQTVVFQVKIMWT